MKIETVPPIGRPIVTPLDAALELYAKGLDIQSRVRILALVDDALLPRLQPEVGDIYFVQRGGAVCDLYVQLAVRPRLRWKATGVLELA